MVAVRLYLYTALLSIHVVAMWDSLLWFYPSFFALDLFAPAALVALGADRTSAFLATWTALVGLYGVTYELLNKSEKFIRVVRRLAELRGWRAGLVGYPALVASAVVLGAMPTAFITWLLRLDYGKAFLIYAGLTAAVSATTSYVAEAAVHWLRYFI